MVVDGAGTMMVRGGGGGCTMVRSGSTTVRSVWLLQAAKPSTSIVVTITAHIASSLLTLGQ